MSLQFVIDAYNLINHPQFKPQKKSEGIQFALVDFIKSNKLTGSANNLTIIVFDGYPPRGVEIPKEQGLSCIFSRGIEADEIIKRIVEDSGNAKNIIVVSDDKEVQLASRLLRARVLGIDEFINGPGNKKSQRANKSDLLDPKLSFSQMQKINKELKEKWL